MTQIHKRNKQTDKLRKRDIPQDTDPISEIHNDMEKVGEGKKTALF